MYPNIVGIFVIWNSIRMIVSRTMFAYYNLLLIMYCDFKLILLNISNCSLIYYERKKNV